MDECILEDLDRRIAEIESQVAMLVQMMENAFMIMDRIVRDWEREELSAAAEMMKTDQMGMR